MIQIERPQDIVWSFLIDPLNLPKWRTAVVEASPGRLYLGAKQEYRTKMLFWPMRVAERVVEFEFERRLSLELSMVDFAPPKASREMPSLKMTTSFYLEPFWGETRVTSRTELTMDGWLAPVIWLNRLPTPGIKRFKDELPRLKRAIEEQHEAA
jgi:hypothetical protein